MTLEQQNRQANLRWGAIALIVLTAAAFVVGRDFPGWVRMWLLAGAMWVGFKLMAQERAKLKGWNHFAFWAWPGMDAEAFEVGQGPSPQESRFSTARRGLLCLLTGIGLIWGVGPHLENLIALGWCGMVAMLLVLHFGVFDILAYAFNRAGIPVRPIMNAPWRAKTLAEFWGVRWNRAFSGVTRVALFRPLVRRVGAVPGTLAGFAFSGLAHELVITVPAGGGYGLPTLYFMVQGMGVFVERRWKGEKSFTSRLFLSAVILLPAYWLFQPIFMEEVMVPFLAILGVN